MESYKPFTSNEHTDYDQNNTLSGPLTGYNEASDAYYFGQYESFNDKEVALQGYNMEGHIKESQKEVDEYADYMFSQGYNAGSTALEYNATAYASEGFVAPTPIKKRAIPTELLSSHYNMLERQGYMSYINPTNTQGVASAAVPYSTQDWTQNGYEYDQFSEYIHEDNEKDLKKHVDHYHLSGGGSLHINPAMIEGLSESDILLHSSSVYDGECSRMSKKNRAVGQPTNIVPTSKMDRKTLKRLRNRVSASRCRIKKKVWINDMEERSNNLNDENDHLKHRIRQLEEAIAQCQNLLAFKSSQMPVSGVLGSTEDSSQTLLDDKHARDNVFGDEGLVHLEASHHHHGW